MADKSISRRPASNNMYENNAWTEHVNITATRACTTHRTLPVMMPGKTAKVFVRIEARQIAITTDVFKNHASPMSPKLAVSSLTPSRAFQTRAAPAVVAQKDPRAT